MIMEVSSIGRYAIGFFISLKAYVSFSSARTLLCRPHLFLNTNIELDILKKRRLKKYLKLNIQVLGKASIILNTMIL